MSKTKSKNTESVKGQSADDFSHFDEQRGHVLLRPDTYVGSVEKEEANMWIYNENRDETEPEFVYKSIKYTPGLYKIFDETIVNARDHVVRCRNEGLELCTIIKVNVDEKTGRITVWNNGASIPVEIKKGTKEYIPTIALGKLLSSSNFDDSKKREGGGLNGYGASLANVFSLEFDIECQDAFRKKKFNQSFSNNMSESTKPVVIASKAKKSYTQVSYLPDYKRFGFKKLTSDVLALFKKRTYDLALTPGVKVYFNDELITSDNFTKYIKMYFKDDDEYDIIIDASNKYWRVGVVYDPTAKMDHHTISFVNGILTNHGGTHCKHVIDKIINRIKEHVVKKTKTKGLVIKPNLIKEHLVFFIDCVVIRPNFINQSKDALTTSISKFEYTYDPTEAFLKKVIKTGVVDRVIAHAMMKAQASLDLAMNKSSNRFNERKYPKLYDAKNANKKKGTCTLILTEGDSAKTLALAGLNEIGRDEYGVFPLRGKLLNVRDATLTKINENEEINAIREIVGLQSGKEYTTLAGLRYGRILILTDQDQDGSHIKGLVINFIHHFWPSLTKYEGFVTSYSTALIKLKKGTGKNKSVIEFYSMQEFEEWKENNNTKNYELKYYKGLGSHNKQEMRSAFINYDEKVKKFYWLDNDPNASKEKSKKLKKTSSKKSNSLIDVNDVLSENVSSTTEVGEYKPKLKDITEDAITLAFCNKRADDRKIWINTYNPKIYIDSNEKRISYYDFIHKELVAFSVYSTMRAVPNIMDGFKPGQRKVIYAAFVKNLTKSYKVNALTGYVMEQVNYHHGDASLNETIIKMAQNFVGSNNINLLVPDGGFGSRVMGGKDYASPRYISTFLSNITKKIFISDDFPVLEHQEEEGVKIEPVYYAPIIPMILVNGAEGIGTGYSTGVRPCNPHVIIENIRRLLNKQKPKPMIPWYRNFTGRIESVDNQTYLIRANYTVDGDKIIITDLPVGTWTDNYKEFIANLTDQSKTKAEKAPVKNTRARAPPKSKGGSKISGHLKDKAKNSQTARVAKNNNIGSEILGYYDNCTDERVYFEITFKPGKLQTYVKNGTLEKNLKLVKQVKLSNMHLFDSNGKIRKFDTNVSILKEYLPVRLELYQKRKDHLLNEWKQKADELYYKLKFILAVIDDKIEVFKKKKDEIIVQLEKLKYPKFYDNKTSVEPSYNYLTSINIIKFTRDEVERLRKEVEDMKEKISILEGKSPETMWLEELDELEIALNKWEEEELAIYEEHIAPGNKKKPVKRKSATRSRTGSKTSK